MNSSIFIITFHRVRAQCIVLCHWLFAIYWYIDNSIKSDIFGRDANPHILQVIVTEHIQAQVVGHHPLVLCVTHAVRCVADIVAMPIEDYHDYQS